MKTNQRAKKVVVLGAGLAGLAAALELMEAGHEVTLLEAQMRPGGRVFTIRDAFADGLYAEAGAAGFIPVESDPVLKYAKRFNLTLAEPKASAFPFLYVFHGKRIDETHFSQIGFPLNLTPEEKKLGMIGMRTKYLKAAVQEILAASRTGDLSELIEKYDRHSFAGLLRGHGASPDAIRLLAILDWDFVDEDLDNHSALDVLAQTAVYSAFAGPRYSIEGGNDILPKTLANALGERIRYGAAVTRISHGVNGVQVGYLQGGILHSLPGEYLICALPFSVLKRLEISPRFSAGKRRAIEELAYASVSRMFLQSRRRFWIDQGLSGYAFTDLPVTFMWDAAAGQKTSRGVLQALMMGPCARRFAALGDEARMRFILQEAEKVYPRIREYSEGGAAKCWDDDPWSLGAYAWFKPGQMATMLPHIASPEGRVHFAGEHTASLLLRGLVQGALESGIRAAREVCEAA